MRSAFFEGERPRIFGHRGAAGVAPENTLVSFERAVADGADFVEMDVQESRDGEILIFHDATLERTTNGQGEVGQRDLKEIKGLDAGYWFSPDDGRTYPYRGRSVAIPTLEEFFATFLLLRATIEVKHGGGPFVERLVATIRRFGREERVLLAAESDEAMGEIRREIYGRDLPVATGFSYGEAERFLRWVWGGRCGTFTPPGHALQLPLSHQGLVLVSEETVRAAHDHEVEVHAWTINDIEEMKRLIRLGVDGIVTDNPALLKRLDEQRVSR